MSPEVCESKPYSSKSDVWALGCLLYELCTLQHAFSADNLLGLVFKIVKGEVDPIPERYSP
jgi:NIMA (never in mitosis gene a)-related kinase